MRRVGGRQMDSPVKSDQPRVSPKKSYLKPTLRIYGNIEKVTLQGISSTTGDNRVKANHKTGG
ncbi:MAG TPA: hypothetical protein VGR97_13605 [Candidatus Acidoferrales bacterium]|nr:hypothetical protein [Candidatus Acidoferrales bacterium]